MNRSQRRATRRHDPHVPVVNEIYDPIDDGVPCPYCREITTGDDQGIFRCSCGWSGLLLGLLP